MRPATDLPANFGLANQGTWRGKKPEYLRVGDVDFPVAPLLRWLGFWLGDGYVCHRKAQPQKQDFIGFCVSNHRKIEAIRAACNAIGVKYTETLGDKTSFFVYDKALLAWLSPMGGAKTKHVPPSMFDLDASLLEELYQGLIDTDGTRQGAQAQEVFSTSSRRLADDFQRLCLHTGRSATCTFHDRETNFGRARGWILSVIQANKRQFWMERDGRKNRSQPAAVRKYPFVGQVHCVTLARHHIMMSRFDGKTVWTGNSWDAFVPQPRIWREVFRVLKPGGHLISFFGTKTYDLGAMAVRFAGFEVVDQLAWMFGSGMPKSRDLSKDIDRKLGAQREVVGKHASHAYNEMKARHGAQGVHTHEFDILSDEPITEEAAAWKGWSTALKPAYEPVLLARKPFEGTFADVALQHGTGSLNIDGCRVPHASDEDRAVSQAKNPGRDNLTASPVYGDDRPQQRTSPHGRWPSNVLLDQEAAEQLDAQSGYSRSAKGKQKITRRSQSTTVATGMGRAGNEHVFHGHGDEGGASRFFWCAKERNSRRWSYCKQCEQFFTHDQDRFAEHSEHPERIVSHPTQKPLELMEYLIRLVTQPGGVVLDPFVGTGTTAVAAKRQGYNFVACDLSAAYASIARARLAAEQTEHQNQLRSGAYLCPACKENGEVTLLERDVVEDARERGRKITCMKCMKRFDASRLGG